MAGESKNLLLKGSFYKILFYMEKILAINMTISIVGAKNLNGGLERSPETFKGTLFFSGIVWDRLKPYSK